MNFVDFVKTIIETLKINHLKKNSSPFESNMDNVLVSKFFSVHLLDF